MLHSLIFFFGMLLLVILSSVDLIVNSSIFCLFLIISIIFKLPFLSIINKIKYFIFALLAIYSLSTPGEIFFYYSLISVTNEGFYFGVNNSLRIINTFLTIMLLMRFIPRKFFINFYVIFFKKSKNIRHNHFIIDKIGLYFFKKKLIINFQRNRIIFTCAINY